MTAFNKIWLGTTDTDPTNAANWLEISVRNSAYSWTASGSGTNEYYLRTAASGDPGISSPGQVLINGTAASSATIGALTAGTWAYGDNDTLGYSTIYVRLSDGTDPDTKARDYVQFRQIPKATDNVTLSSTASRAMAGTDWSAVAINAFYIEPGYKNLAIGDRETPLRIDPDSFISDGSGSQPWYIDVSAAAISPEIRNAPTPGTGVNGLYLIGSALVSLIVDRGDVALAGLTGDTATCATIIIRGGQAKVLVGEGVAWTTMRQFAGTSILRSNGTTLEGTGGQAETQLAMTLTNVNLEGAQLIDKSTGTFTNVTLDSGTYDTMQLGGAKTVGTFKHNAGVFKENVDLLTITTRSEPDYAGTVDRKRLA